MFIEPRPNEIALRRSAMFVRQSKHQFNANIRDTTELTFEPEPTLRSYGALSPRGLLGYKHRAPLERFVIRMTNQAQCWRANSFCVYGGRVLSSHAV